eukprot:63759-Prymnesium_polylepis.1
MPPPSRMRIDRMTAPSTPLVQLRCGPARICYGYTRRRPHWDRTRSTAGFTGAGAQASRAYGTGRRIRHTVKTSYALSVRSRFGLDYLKATYRRRPSPSHVQLSRHQARRARRHSTLSLT